MQPSLLGASVVVSDDSSADNDSHKQENETFMMTEQTNNISSIKFDSSASFDSVPLQVPRPTVFQTPNEPHADISSNSGDVGVSSMANNWGDWTTQAVLSQNLIAADKVLDEAVDELFNNSDPMTDDVANLDDVWDTSAFGDSEGSTDLGQNDTELGFLLERLIQGN